MKKGEIEQQPIDRPGGGKLIVEWSRPHWLAGADPKRPLRLEVTAPLAQPSATGMPEGPETLALENLEHRLVKAAKKASGELVMRVAGAGAQVFVFYLPSQAGLVRKRDTKALLEPQIANAAEAERRELGVAWADDPAWSRLLDVYAAYDPGRWQEDRALLIDMAKAGDAIHARRSVAHRVTFAEREGCAPFLREMRRLRLKPEGGPKRRKDGRWVALIERLEPTIATWHLHPIVLSIKTVAEQHGGTYEGWETEFIQSLVPPPLSPPGKGG